MILLLSVVISVLFGTGALLMLKRDLLRVVAGVTLLSNAANLALMSSALFRGSAPIFPLRERISDPLVQALTLTAIVISFGTSALLLSLVYRVYTSHQAIDQRALTEAEQHEEAELEREREREVV
jgi:multicomponent Na+:H+ antiporter subunit C